MGIKKIHTVGIVIPVYNEKSAIKKTIDNVIKSNTLGLKKEIIVVDDGSTDGTDKILEQLEKNNLIKLIKNDRNYGKGYSVKRAFQATTSDIVMIQDADQEYSQNDYPELLMPIVNGYADVVFGSRFANSKPHRVMNFHHYLANKFLTNLSNIFTNLNLSDIEVGFKLFTQDIIKEITPQLKSQKFGFEPEIIAKVSRIPGIRIYEVGISYFGRGYDEGKKITWIDGFKAIFEIIKYNIFY